MILGAQVGISQQTIEEIIATPIVFDEPDTPRWTLSKSGKLTLASAWETIRSQRPIIPALEDIWHECITTSMSIFIWCLLSNRIPVDTKLQWRKIELASKCYCCPSQPGIESLQHLFVNGVGASKVWRAFDQWFPGVSNPLRPDDSIPERLEGWSKRTNQHEKTHLCRIIPCLIMWFLWAERNRCRHNEVEFKPQIVAWHVRIHIQNLMGNGKLHQKQRRGVEIPMPTPTQVEPLRPALLGRLERWKPPDPPWIKLNTAVSFSGNTGRANGGGLIRDHCGHLLLAFSASFAATSALEASAKTVRIGLAEAKNLGTHVQVETDDPQVVRLTNGKCYGPAQSRSEMARLRLMQRECTTSISNVCSAMNKAAACLAKLGGDPETLTYFDGSTAPSCLKAIIRREQLEVPLRKRNLGSKPRHVAFVRCVLCLFS